MGSSCAGPGDAYIVDGARLAEAHLESQARGPKAAARADDVVPQRGHKSVHVEAQRRRDVPGDDGVVHLAGLTNMQWLNLDNTQITDVGLAQLSAMNQLKFLHLGSTAVSDAGLRFLAPLTALEELKVTRTAVTETGVEQLKEELPNTQIQLE